MIGDGAVTNARSCGCVVALAFTGSMLMSMATTERCVVSAWNATATATGSIKGSCLHANNRCSREVMVWVSCRNGAEHCVEPLQGCRGVTLQSAAGVCDAGAWFHAGDAGAPRRPVIAQSMCHGVTPDALCQPSDRTTDPLDCHTPADRCITQLSARLNPLVLPCLRPPLPVHGLTDCEALQN